MKKFNISEYVITKAGEVAQVSRIQKNGNVLILLEKDEPDWDGSAIHLYERVEKGRNLMRFNKRNLVKYCRLSDFELGMLGM